jgi:hypothetical protein
MNDRVPDPGRYRFRDATFLLAIAVLALVCGAVSFYVQNIGLRPSVTATVSDDRPGVPLPAGPRKYQ